MKITVLQMEDTRYTFILDDTKKNSSCGRYKVKCETMMSLGSSVHIENTTKEKGNQLYKFLLGKGFHKFRNLREASWYATLPNNTDREEEWKVENGYFIPIKSSVLMSL